MAVINPKDYYYLSSSPEPECVRMDSEPHLFYHRDFNDHMDYYYLEIKDGDALGHFTLRSLIDWELILKIRDPDNPLHLVICNSHEAFDSVVEPIYRHVVLSHHIPAEKIILMTGSFDIADTIEQASYKFRRGMLKAELVLDFETATQSTYKNYDSFAGRPFRDVNTLEHKQYSKKYLNFNRRWRAARPTFVALLVARGLLDQGHVSLAPSDCGHKWPDFWDNLIHINHEFPQIIDLIKLHRGEIINLPPLYLDTDDLVTNQAMLSDQTGYLYENTYFSLIAETNYYTNHIGFEKSRFLSEKAFKPIIFKHPFVFISTPGILRCLKQIGYQTFDPIIDESYDSIENDGDRMLAILDETERLCNLTEQQLTGYLNTCREICDYNYNLLIGKTQFTHKLNY